MLPAGLLLVLEGFLGVIGGAGRVFYRTLNVRINPGQSQLKFKTFKDEYLFTISPWFSTRTAMSMNISCSSLIDCSSLMNISCLSNRWMGAR